MIEDENDNSLLFVKFGVAMSFVSSECVLSFKTFGRCIIMKIITVEDGYKRKE